PKAIGNEVFFLGHNTLSSTWGLFQVNDDGVTAAPISSPSSPYTYGLAAIGSDLFYFASDGVTTDQLYRLTPGATPGAAGSPVQITSFTQQGGFMGDLFQGGDGNIYFSREETATGRELWVLDTSDPAGARLVADLNTDVQPGGYDPDQVVAAPDPLEQWLMGSYHPGGGGGGAIAA
ncbi:MAG: hypothetical protein IT555_01105, partial [Acetobacteraceae bacterium]|nr:hypothetical protein [Acetobacteraceae bacterium]